MYSARDSAYNNPIYEGVPTNSQRGDKGPYLLQKNSWIIMKWIRFLPTFPVIYGITFRRQSFDIFWSRVYLLCPHLVNLTSINNLLVKFVRVVLSKKFGYFLHLWEEVLLIQNSIIGTIAPRHMYVVLLQHHMEASQKYLETRCHHVTNAWNLIGYPQSMILARIQSRSIITMSCFNKTAQKEQILTKYKKKKRIQSFMYSKLQKF